MLALCLRAVLSSQTLAPKPIPPIDWNDLPYQETVRRMAQGWRAKYGLPGVWCAFIKDGRVVACVADGYRNLETKAPADVRDHLNVGSVSKVITGTLIAELVAKGVITYETTVGETFPELAKRHPDGPFVHATLAQLMAHTAGITDRMRFDTSNRPDGRTWRYGHVETALASPLAAISGTAYEYCNAGAVIATAMVEKTIYTKHLEGQVGTTYEDWYHGPLAKAIGLTDPTMLDYPRLPAKNEVQPYYLSDGSAASNYGVRRESFVFAPQGSCSITLTDFCRFAMATLDNSMGLPLAGYHGVFDRVTESVRSDTYASWHKATLGWMFHEGNTGRGEWAVTRVDPAKGAAFVFYTNANFKGGVVIPPDSFGGSVQVDLNHLYRP